MFRTVFEFLGVATSTPVTAHDPFRSLSESQHDYNTANGREEMSQAMRKAIKVYAKDKPSQHYSSATQHCPGSIEQLINDGQKNLGAIENRPCRGGSSKVHKLRCGHFVYTVSPALCGRDCQDRCAVIDNIGFICIMCFRDAACREEKKYPERWWNLLLPATHKPEAEDQYVKDFEVDSRRCDPAYIDPSGCVLIANHPVTATLICAWESYREALLEQRVQEACTSLDFPEIVVDLALNNLNALLCNHQTIERVELAIVGAICIILTCSFEGIELQYEDVRGYFDAPKELRIHTYISQGRETLNNLVAHEKLDRCLDKIPRKHRQDKYFKKKEISAVARRIRSHALTHMGCSGRVKQALYSYIIAACVQQAMRHYKLRISMQELCEAMNLDPDSLVDAAFIKVENPKLTKANYAEDRIRRHTGSLDWRKPIGTKKDEARKNREKRLKADKNTKDITDTLKTW